MTRVRTTIIGVLAVALLAPASAWAVVGPSAHPRAELRRRRRRRARARSTPATSTRRSSTRSRAGTAPTTCATPAPASACASRTGRSPSSRAQNDVLIGPVTIEKPMRDGYITRFKPNLVRADGTVPPVEQVHLHHGTWLSEPSYGSGPFFAAGEEKTIAPFPQGLRHADQGDRPVAAAPHGPLRRQRADGDLHHLRHRLRAQGRGREAGDEARLPRVARRAALRLPGLQRPARVRQGRASARGRWRSARGSTRTARRSSARASRATGRARTSTCPSSTSRSARSTSSRAAR